MKFNVQVIFSIIVCLFTLNNYQLLGMEEITQEFSQKLGILNPLALAIEHNDREEIKQAILNGVDPNIETFNFNPLVWAVKNSDFELIIFLLAHGADPSLRMKQNKYSIRLLPFINGYPELSLADKDFLKNLFSNPGQQFLEATSFGYLDFAIKLLDQNPNLIKGIDANGSILLHHAALDSNGNAIKLLLQWGADINAQNNAGKTPLIELLTSTSPEENKIEALKTFLSFGPDLNYKTHTGNLISALDYATDQSLKEILISHGAE